MPNNLKLGVLGRATGANPYTTMETSLASDCAGTTSGPVKMSEFLTDGVSSVTLDDTSIANNQSANFYYNFLGLTDTPGEPGYRFNRIGTTAGNFTYGRLSGVNQTGWVHQFIPASDLDWTVQIQAVSFLFFTQVINCSVQTRFYDHGYNSDSSNYNTYITQNFVRSALGNIG